MTEGIDSAAAEDLRAGIDRVLRLREEVKAIQSDIADVYAEYKAKGHDTKAMKAVVNHVEKRAKDPHAVEEGEQLFELYLTAYDGTGTRRAIAQARPREAAE